MALPYSLKSMLKMSVTIEPFLSQDEYSNATYGNPYTVACLIHRKPKRVKRADGEEVVSNVTIYCDTTEVTVKDRLTLPNGDQPPFLYIERYSNTSVTEWYGDVFYA